MKQKFVILSLIILSLTGSAFAGDKLIAYPVPFDPEHQSLQIKFQPDRAPGSVHVEIFDVNGDSILSRDYPSADAFRWKGYNLRGQQVSNGLYIIKTRWEDSSTGKIKTDAVRITVLRKK